MRNFYLIFSFFCLFSCQKDRFKPDKPVYAGLINDNMIYKEYSPVFELNLIGDGCSFSCKDSIDLNNDKKFDVFLDAFYISDDFYSSRCCPGDCYPLTYYQIRGTNNLEFAVYYQKWDNDYNWSFADTLSYNYEIDTILQWSAITDLWRFPSPVSMGAWHNLNKEMYIGIRSGNLSNFKFGWIKIKGDGATDKLKFMAYAIEN